MNIQANEKPLLDPLWYKDAVIYQLHIKSFFDANNDGVGDFAGLNDKLDYIAEIGVTAIWLLPFYPSPRRDDGYDISEYRDVHPDYGTLSDVRRFIHEAHRRGIRVITELVINHTSDQHPWFQRARKAKRGSVARDFYVWSDDDKKYSGTRVIFLDTQKSNWTWDDEAQAYFWHRFYPHQPDLNFDNPHVLKAIFGTMRFWLDLGVDGLRLDAVPYLVEREGTNNENLPETHAILKRLRAEMDRHYPDRMLLAEANQWPEDAQSYFGNGDECHMAFHFPLMPRMYMAIAQEDRFPITDIMRQTPDIPPQCQWAIFLRNHDELTLEMVTDKERDYLWEVYASDARARLNLGIRRRLAPLLERDRRRIELMKSLLLTMPGTPVVYYGDEIGMGDNVHLGDRDGVRTPMQWSSDRNGGFSRADPSALVLPAIMDPLYGFEAVNVEAQWRDSHSLLNWFRRMLVVRRQHKAFGRGSIRFLRPQNRKVLAYLREQEGEAILCVANVSRSAQAVELDLAEFEGRTPVELSGGSSFPLIGKLTYLLTLPPYGFYWFILSAEATPPAWSSATAGPPTELHTFVVKKELLELMQPPVRAVLEHEILPAYLPQRRWFQQKDRAIEVAEVAMSCTLPHAKDVIYSEIQVRAGETQLRYALPLAVSWEGDKAFPFEAPLSVARLRRGPRVGLLTDAFASPAFAGALISNMGARTQTANGAAGLEFCPTSAFDGSALSSDAQVEWPAAEQTNSTLIVGQKIVLKLFRRLSIGIHPEAEMTRYLTERGYGGIPPLLGEVVRVDGDGHRATVAVMQSYVSNQGDGWKWMQGRLSRLVEENATPYAEASDPKLNTSAGFIRIIGRRLGEMHAILSQPSDQSAFAPKTTDAEGADTIARRAIEQFDLTLAALSPAALGDKLDSERADLLTSQRGHIIETINRLACKTKGALQIRIHGDMHLGQLLVSGSDIVFIDFEGEPSKTLDQRRAKMNPLQDVAGMLRSFDYAVAATERANRQTESGEGGARAEKLLSRFRKIAEVSFLHGYCEGIGRDLRPDEMDALRLFLLEKAAYEVAYEAANRPDWLSAPLCALANFTERLIAHREAADA